MHEKEKRLHETLSFIGLRAQATAIGLIQLACELRRVGVLGPDAIDRIKDAIAKDIVLSCPRSVSREDYDRSVRQRLDRVFAGEEAVGDATEMGIAVPE